MKQVYIDANIFIYTYEKHPVYYNKCVRLISKLETEHYMGITSVITLLEVVNPSFVSKTSIDYIRLSLLELCSLEIRNVTMPIIELALDIKLKYHIKTADAIHLATAIEAGCDTFITNDKQIQKVKGLKILYLDKLV